MTAAKITSKSTGKTQQFVTAVIVNVAAILVGINAGWPSPLIPQLRSDRPPVGDTPMSEHQISWICGFSPIGSILAIPFCGTLSERIGRKNFTILSGLPHIVFILLVIFAQNHVHLYASRLIGGIAAAMTFFIVPLYVGETAAEDVRGLLGSLLLLASNVGVLFAFVAGAYLPYRLFASLCLIFPTVFVVATFFIPETPAYLVRRDRQLQAHESLMFYRGGNRALVEQELAELQCKAKMAADRACKSTSLREFFGDRATRKGLIISLGLIAAQSFSGIVPVTLYTQTIFKLAGSSVSSEVASIIIALFQIVGSQASTMLMERAGRRMLSLVSCLGMAVSLSVVALFFHLQRVEHDVSAITWLPLLGLSGYIVSYCLGIGPVPYVVISEVFKLHVASFATTLCLVFCYSLVFSTIRIFDLGMQLWGADGSFLMFATFCAIGFVFCYCTLPETKGRRREDIVNELAGTGWFSGDEACRGRL